MEVVLQRSGSQRAAREGALMFIIDDGKLSDKEVEWMLAVDSRIALWLPDMDNGPQMMAYLSPATVTGFGGAAGGGKSELGIGKALNQHSDSIVMRRVGTELQPIITRLLQLHGSRDGYSGGNVNVLRMPEREVIVKPEKEGDAEAYKYAVGNKTIAFGSIPNLGDEMKYQGHPHDFKFYDEATNFLVQQVRFLGTWLRNTRVQGQVCEQLFAFNPPQHAEGRWVIEYFAPWLDKQYKNPAAHGELRYFITVSRGSQQVDLEVPNKPHVFVEGQPVSDFDPKDYTPIEIVQPQSRTFIGSKVTDNKYQNSAYLAQLQSLPEPLRSQMLNGDFYAGLEDSEWQVIPSAWIKAAMNRWQPRDRKPPMDSTGVDVARGGRDNSIIARRHDNWYDVPVVIPGKDTPNGYSLMARIVAELRDDAPVHIDVVGVGGSPFDFLTIAKFQTIGVNGGSKDGVEGYRTQGGLHFANWKAYLWWAMREDLDPSNNVGVSLPPDPQLEKDLSAPLWKVQGGRVVVETREDIIKRIGRSPDWGSAYVLARLHTPKLAHLERGKLTSLGHDPLAALDLAPHGGGHDPFRRF
jgi:hypothetical protein